jgi:hypothetical protein
MAWPAWDGNVQCVGFDREALSILRAAIDECRVKIVPGSRAGYAEAFQCEFDYLGFRYRLHEMSEIVTSIVKIGKTPESSEREQQREKEMQVGPTWGTW